MKDPDLLSPPMPWDLTVTDTGHVHCIDNCERFSHHVVKITKSVRACASVLVVVLAHSGGGDGRGVVLWASRRSSA